MPHRHDPHRRVDDAVEEAVRRNGKFTVEEFRELRDRVTRTRNRSRLAEQRACLSHHRVRVGPVTLGDLRIAARQRAQDLKLIVGARIRLCADEHGGSPTSLGDDDRFAGRHDPPDDAGSILAQVGDRDDDGQYGHETYLLTYVQRYHALRSFPRL
jgi:hypothetical protein